MKNLILALVCIITSSSVMAYTCTSSNYLNSFNNNERNIRDHFIDVLADAGHLWLNDTKESMGSLEDITVKMTSVGNGVATFLTGELVFTTLSNKRVRVSHLSLPEIIMPVTVKGREFCGFGPFDVVSRMFDVEVEGEIQTRTYFLDVAHSEISIPMN